MALVEREEDEKQALARLANDAPVPTPSGTLLPAPIASLVSLATRSSSLYLSVGSFIGGLAIDGARVTTLTGLDLSRSVVEGILLRAGRDVADRSCGALGRKEAEGLLERSVSATGSHSDCLQGTTADRHHTQIAALHSTLTQASFLVSTGFHVSSATLASASNLSLHVLSALDSILGSTESSRAIASIITLIRREFQNPETGIKGERVGVLDLLVGVSGLALLQRWCRKTIETETRDSGAEKTVWDVVILDNGRRADVTRVTAEVEGKGFLLETTDTGDGADTSKTIHRSPSFVQMTGRSHVFDTVQRYDKLRDAASSSTTDDDDSVTAWPEADIREQIVAQLPPDAKVSITTEAVTTKTVTVEVSGAEPWDIKAPPGVEVVEENAHHQVEGATEDGLGIANFEGLGRPKQLPWYRIVYKTSSNRLRSTSVEAGDAAPAIELPYHPQAQKELPETPPEMDPTGPVTDIFQDRPPTSPDPVLSTDTAARRTSASSTDQAGPRRPLTKDRSSNARAPKRSPTHPNAPNNAANQKRSRKPRSPSPGHSDSDRAGPLHIKMPLPNKLTKDKKSEKKEGSRKVLKRGTSISNLANIWHRDSSTAATAAAKSKEGRPPWGASVGAAGTKKLPASSHLPVPPRGSSNVPAKVPPQAPQRGNPNYFSSRDLGYKQGIPPSPSRSNYYAVHERRRNSTVSQTDTYSIHSRDQATRPSSPVQARNLPRPTSSLLRARSETNTVAMDQSPSSPRKMHRRSKSYIPSIYTLATNNSQASLVPADETRPGPVDDNAAIMTLHRSGQVNGLFPRHHLVRNITRYVRFASASYGSSFLRVMGISATASSSLVERDLSHHAEHHSFSTHTRLPPSTILLSSFVDPQGGSNSAGETNTGVPLVHYVSLDHDSKAVVLTCRGTLGFEDVLTDMTCDYDDLWWRGRNYRVHKGIHASASRLLHGGGGRVMATIKAALEEFADYGFVLCGHSLGGGVAAVLAIMIAEPNGVDPSESAFVTLRSPPQPLLITSGPGVARSRDMGPLRLPSGRAIHVYAYGPPASVSPSLRLATRGLITTVVNGHDLVPYLSLGLLRDLQAIALAFKTDTSNAKGEVRSRVWEGLSSGLTERVYGTRPGVMSEEDDQWAYSALKSLRASMLSPKLMPPGEVFMIDTQRVLQRDAFTAGDDGVSSDSASLGRPATRAVLKLIRDVEGRFGEVRFGGSMLGDHSPGRYELSLSALGKGVLGDQE